MPPAFIIFLLLGTRRWFTGVFVTPLGVLAWAAVKDKSRNGLDLIAH